MVPIEIMIRGFIVPKPSPLFPYHLVNFGPLSSTDFMPSLWCNNLHETKEA